MTPSLRQRLERVMEFDCRPANEYINSQFVTPSYEDILQWQHSRRAQLDQAFLKAVEALEEIYKSGKFDRDVSLKTCNTLAAIEQAVESLEWKK